MPKIAATSGQDNPTAPYTISAWPISINAAAPDAGLIGQSFTVAAIDATVSKVMTRRFDKIKGRSVAEPIFVLTASAKGKKPLPS